VPKTASGTLFHPSGTFGPAGAEVDYKRQVVV
jgi:hypothetical protein